MTPIRSYASAAAIFLGADKRERYLSLFGYTAYFDGSGSPDDGTILCVGGYASMVNDWIEFEREWNAVLKWAKVDHFHMKDFVSNRRQFANKKWERKEVPIRLAPPVPLTVDTQRPAFVTATTSWGSWSKPDRH
jgi:hypothetical protein